MIPLEVVGTAFDRTRPGTSEPLAQGPTGCGYPRMTELIQASCWEISPAPAVFSRSELSKTPRRVSVPRGAMLITGPPESPPAGTPETFAMQKSEPPGTV